MKLHLLTLVGIGDLEFKLVDQETWDYIFSPRPNFGKTHGFLETPPKNIQVAMKAAGRDEDTVYVTSGSCENDRALSVSFLVAGEDAQFFHMKELHAFMKKHDIEIDREWEGGIY